MSSRISLAQSPVHMWDIWDVESGLPPPSLRPTVSPSPPFNCPHLLIMDPDWPHFYGPDLLPVSYKRPEGADREPVDILYHHLGGKFVGSDRRIIRGYRRTPIITTRHSQNVLPGVFSRHEVADTQPEDLQQLCLPKLRQTVPRWDRSRFW